MMQLIPETDAGHLHQTAINLYQLALDMRRPSMMLKPRLSIDGNQWCALHGENLQDGVAGFGDSPELAYLDFDRAWCAKISEVKHS